MSDEGGYILAVTFVFYLGFKFYLFRFPVSRSRRCARWPAPRIPRAQARAHAPRAARKVREGTFPHGGDATSILYGIKPYKVQERTVICQTSSESETSLVRQGITADPVTLFECFGSNELHSTVAIR